MLTLSGQEARRIAVRAQFLDAYRPQSLLEVMDQLAGVQIDPTTAVARSQELVLWSRLGDAFSPADLTHALEVERTVAEHVTLLRPMADMGVVLAVADEWVNPATSAWVEANAAFRDRIVARLRADGAQTAATLPNDPEVPYASTGWDDERNTGRMLEVLCLRGEVAVSGREGRRRLWDLAERVYPADLHVPPPDEARAIRDERRLLSLGIAREKPLRSPAEPSPLGPIGLEAVVEGVEGTWRVHPDVLGAEWAGDRAALLSPFDRMVYDRDRARDLFGFEYVLEMYKPAAQRRWGYFALPILLGDRLIGKLDAKADRKKGVLTVNAIHEDVPLSPADADAVDAELEALADWLGLELRR
jgi:uncharacterized protein YcaQ